MIRFKKSEWRQFCEHTKNAVSRINERNMRLKVKDADHRNEIGAEECRRYDDKIDALIEKAQIRTLKSMSTNEVAFDAYQLIMFNAWRDDRDRSFGLSVIPSGVCDMNVDEHLLELQERQAIDLWKFIQDTLSRYNSGEITADEYQYFEHYEKYVVED